jgi:hypothetical protein
VTTSRDVALMPCAGDPAFRLIQRFGSALNLSAHFHLLVLDGVYCREGEGRLRL